MVGSPFQTPENLADDMLFLTELNPQMVGIGPFIPHHDTPFADRKAGTLELTLFMLGLIRLLLPKVLLPATTALGTIAPDGREQGVLAGAKCGNAQPLPAQVREKYLLYDNKLCTGKRSGREPERPGSADGGNRISCHCVPRGFTEYIVCYKYYLKFTYGKGGIQTMYDVNSKCAMILSTMKKSWKLSPMRTRTKKTLN